MNGAEWFFLESGRQMGPVPLDQLVTLLKTRLPAGTFVWCDGMADWLKAEDVADLAIACAVALGLALGLGLLGASVGRESPSVLLLVLMVILTTLIMGIALGASVRRLHDLGQPGWYVLVSLLPCLGFLFLLYLLVAPGSASAAAAPSSSKAVPDIQ